MIGVRKNTKSTLGQKLGSVIRTIGTRLVTSAIKNVSPMAGHAMDIYNNTAAGSHTEYIPSGLKKTQMKIKNKNKLEKR